jgi:hypothetical protein
MSDAVIIAIIAVAVPSVAAITGLYTAVSAKRNRQSEADKAEAEAGEIRARARSLILQNEATLLARLLALERGKDDCAARIAALENERVRYERLIMKSNQLQQALEQELSDLREKYEAQIMGLKGENEKLRQKVERLANRVETGELGSGAHQTPPNEEQP